jgi:hypothetical protein
MSALRHFLPEDTSDIIKSARGRLLSGDHSVAAGGQTNAS